MTSSGRIVVCALVVVEATAFASDVRAQSPQPTSSAVTPAATSAPAATAAFPPANTAVPPEGTAVAPSPNDQAPPAPSTEPAAPPPSVPPAPQQQVPPPNNAYGYRYAYPYPYYAPRPPPPPQAEREWYGWQTLISDSVSVSLFVIGAGAENGAIAGIGLLTHIFGPPIIHWGHGNVGKGFASFGIRAGSFTILYLGAVSCVLSDSNDGGCSLAVVGLLGLIAAIPIDAAVLAYKKSESDVALGPLRNVGLAPSFGPARSVRQARGYGEQYASRLPDNGGLRGGFVLSGQF